MQKFNFRLQKILDLRTHLEKEEKNRFSKVFKEYNLLDTSIKEMNSERRNLLFASDCNGFDLLCYVQREKAREGLKNRIVEKTKLLREKKIELERAREKYLQRKKEKRVLEILREKKWEEYEIELNREEQNDLDEQGNFITYYKENPFVNKLREES